MGYEQSFVGKQIGNYRIVAPIATGAYGVVYRAEHQVLSGRIVAVKLLHAYLGSAQEREQFVQEAQFLERVHHPHMLPIIDVGFSHGLPYIITPFAYGGSLRDRLRYTSSDPLPLNEVLSLLTQVGEALHYAHEQGIVHRDLKPENILFNEQGGALLADFGLATALASASSRQTRHVGGTPPYMAPEQFQGVISREGDQYALGCISYELLTGRRPFTAPDFISMGFKHMTEAPISPSTYNPELPLHVEQAILRALAKARSERFPDVQAFIEALRKPVTTSHAMPKVTGKSLIPHNPHIATPHIPTPVTPPKRTFPRLPESKPYDETFAALKRTTQRDPSYARAHNKKGLVDLQFQHYSKALSAFQQACTLDPDNSEYHNNRGAALYELGRYYEALVAYEHAISLSSGTADYHSNRGNAFYKLERYHEALACYEHAILLDINKADYRNNCGNALYRLKRYHKALAAYEQACDLAPDIADYHNNRGNTLFELLRYEDALASYEKAARLKPRVGLYHANVGNALGMLGKRWQAYQAHSHAKKLGYKRDS